MIEPDKIEWTVAHKEWHLIPRKLMEVWESKHIERGERLVDLKRKRDAAILERNGIESKLKLIERVLWSVGILLMITYFVSAYVYIANHVPLDKTIEYLMCMFIGIVLLSGTEIFVGFKLYEFFDDKLYSDATRLKLEFDTVNYNQAIRSLEKTLSNLYVGEVGEIHQKYSREDFTNRLRYMCTQKLAAEKEADLAMNATNRSNERIRLALTALKERESKLNVMLNVLAYDFGIVTDPKELFGSKEKQADQRKKDESSNSSSEN